MPTHKAISFSVIVITKCRILAEDLHTILSKHHAAEPFVHVQPFGKVPQTRHERGSNMTFIGVVKDRTPGRAIIGPRSKSWSRAPPAKRCRI